MGEILSEDPNGGRVMMCPHCEDVHLTVDNVSLRLRRSSFLGLACMLQEAVRKLFPGRERLAERGEARPWPGSSLN